MEKLSKILILIMSIGILYSCRNKNELIINKLSVDKKLIDCLSTDLDYYKKEYMSNKADSIFILYVEKEKKYTTLQFYLAKDIEGIFPKANYYGCFHCNDILILYAINNRKESINPLFKVSKKTITLTEDPLPPTKENLSEMDYFYDPYFIEYNFKNGNIHDKNICDISE